LPLSPLTPITAIVPLVAVLAISMLREAIEDCVRNSSDRKVNGTKVRTFKNGKWMDTTSADVKVGDILMFENEETFCCDCIMISTSSPEEVAYIQTSSLDGEKNLKKKELPALTE
jgi:P-type E1-E2 ATPase